MMTLRALCVLASAFVCAAAQAQDCSGGAGGGVDATGNQCSVGADDQYVARPAAMHARSSAAVAASSPLPAAPTGSRMVGTASAAPAAAPARQAASRFPDEVRAPAEPVHTAKIGDGQVPSCSGGADGGIDATGNQCTSVATAAILAVAVRGR
jgi:hypothetical protein